MLLIKTKIGISSIHGFGLFADEFIPKGTEIWRFTPGFDRKFTGEEILDFPELLQIYIYKYGWRSKTSKLYIFSGDNDRYFNHSETPNCSCESRDGEEEPVAVALRDIEIGEEMTEDYSSFEDEKSEGDVLGIIAEKYNLKDELDPRLKNRF